MKRLHLCTISLAALVVAAPASAQFGRQLDLIADPVGSEVVPSQGATFDVLPVVGIFWDERCAQVEYTFNATAGANVGAPTEISPEELASAVQDGLDRWNAIPTSFIEMNVTAVEELGDRPRIGGDFVNEVTFITPDDFGALASSPSTSLTADTTFVTGDDLDGDGDSDVFDPAAEGITKCTDIDDDGDIEFPAGDYLAGTILDNDVQFSSTVEWELEPTSVTPVADVDAVSTHEFGHSHGHNHALINQISAEDGTGSTMFPFIDTSDAATEFGNRTLHSDDIAVSSFIYPEGSKPSGIAALQAGDVPFDLAFDILRGEVTTDGLPIAGANVTAVDRNTDEEVSGTYSGRTVVFGDDAGGLFAFPESVLDGSFELAVPSRDVYRLNIEALDGDPAATTNISTNAIIGGILGQNLFPEEGLNGFRESSLEFRPDFAFPFFSRGSRSQSLDFETNAEIAQSNAGDVEFIGTGLLAGATSVVYAELFDRDEVSAMIANGDVPISGSFNTGTLDASLVPIFDRAALMLGFVNDDDTVTLTTTLSETRNFVGQDGDLTPFVFPNSRGLPFRIRREFNRDPDLQLFLVLEADELEPGPSGFPPAFLALDADVEGTSYQSFSGSPLELRLGSTWSAQINYVNDGGPVPRFLTDF